MGSSEAESACMEIIAVALEEMAECRVDIKRALHDLKRMGVSARSAARQLGVGTNTLTNLIWQVELPEDDM